jgi:hypothetical protein
MPGKDGWLYDLVVWRYVNFPDLKNGSLDLIDLIKIYDAHLMDLENTIRIREYHDRKKAD